MVRVDSAGNPNKKRRLKAVSEAFEASRLVQVEESLDAAKPDDALFFIDTGAATTLPPTKSKAEKRRRFFSEKPSCVAMPSVHLVKAVQRIVKSQEGGGGGGGGGGKKTTTTTKEGVYDMWGSDPAATTTTTTNSSSKKKKGGKKAAAAPAPKVKNSQLRVLKTPAATLLPLIDRPLPGQSYHPSAEEHQVALEQALAVEEKREAHKAKLKQPLGQMSEETKALLLSDSDSEAEGEEEEEEEEEEEDAVAGRMIRKKKKGKLTKAERNKQRRRKAADHQAILDKEQKVLSHQATRARELTKALRKQGGNSNPPTTSTKGKEKKKKYDPTKPFAPKDLPTEKVALPQDKNPLQARSLPVPLSDELGGSLRLLKTKGNLASETLEGLQRRGQYEPVPHRKSARPKERVKYAQKIRGD